VKFKGKQHYLWRAVDQDGDVVDVYLQVRRDAAAAKRFFRRLLRSHGVAHRELIADAIHDNTQ
jgi:putative transposase